MKPYSVITDIAITFYNRLSNKNKNDTVNTKSDYENFTNFPKQDQIIQSNLLILLFTLNIIINQN